MLQAKLYGAGALRLEEVALDANTLQPDQVYVETDRLPARRMREAYELAKEHSKDLVAAVFEWRD